MDMAPSCWVNDFTAAAWLLVSGFTDTAGTRNLLTAPHRSPMKLTLFGSAWGADDVVGADGLVPGLAGLAWFAQPTVTSASVATISFFMTTPDRVGKIPLYQGMPRTPVG
ncbi:hypothetical protein GCM10029964_040350 [Kibdelosporangium lantanae]